MEVALNLADIVAVRDPKNPEGPRLIAAPAAWQAFTGLMKSSQHDLA